MQMESTYVGPSRSSMSMGNRPAPQAMPTPARTAPTAAGQTAVPPVKRGPSKRVINVDMATQAPPKRTFKRVSNLRSSTGR